MNGPRALDFLLVAPALEYTAPTLYALNLATGLMERGVKIQVVTPGGRFEQFFRERGIPLDVRPFLDRFVIDWFLLRRMVRDLRRSGVRAVHALSSIKVEGATALASRLGVPTIVTVHHHYDIIPVEVDWTGVGAIITFSENLRADVVNRRRASKDLVRVIPSGVVAPASHRPPFDRAGAVPIVGTLGDIQKAKALEDFVRVAGEVLARAPGVEFLVVSGGAEPRSLRQLAREAGVARAMTFTTFIDTPKILNVMDVCVLPGAEEGPGQTILEAMATGRPVITAGEGAAYDVIQDEVTGLLVEKGDRSKLADAIVRLVQDRELARRLGAAARQVALERFPLGRMLDETLAAYESAIGAYAT